jgi:two-component system cell cycle response regulator
MGVDPLRVRWLADALPAELVRALADEQVELVPEDAAAEVVVLDAHAWPHRAHKAGGGMPLLLLLETESLADVPRLLSALPPGAAVEPAGLHPRLLARRLRELGSAPELRVDQVTGLANRRAFHTWLAEEPGHPAVVMLLGLDGFAGVNERHGPLVGDRVLAEVARRLAQVAPRRSVLARLGSDEFGLGIPYPEGDVRLMAEYLRVNARLDGFPVSSDGQPAAITVPVSCGLAEGERGSRSPLLNRAWTAMVAAKAKGGDRLVAFDEYELSAGDHGVEQQAFEDLVRVLSRRTFDAIISQGVRVISGIRDEADRDGLTGLPNRRTLDRRLEREVGLARETGRPLSVAFVDVDDFRSVNTRFNWQMGDAVLRHVAQGIERAIGGAGWVGRYGGEEFCVVLPGYPLAPAWDVLERCRGAVAVDDFALSDRRSLPITVSVGVAELQDGEDIRSTIERVQAWTKTAKNAGKDQVRPLPAEIGAGTSASETTGAGQGP